MADTIIPITTTGRSITGIGGQSAGLSMTHNPTTISNELQNDINISKNNPSPNVRANEKYLGDSETFANAQRGLLKVTAGIIAVQTTMNALEQSENAYDVAGITLGVASIGLALIPGVGVPLALGATALQPLLAKGSQIVNKNRVARLNTLYAGARVNKR